MKNLFRNASGEVNTQVVIAVIGATATLLTAIIAGIFGIIQIRAARTEPPAPVIVPTQTAIATAAPTDTPASSPTAAPLALAIEGPTEAPLNELTFFTILSENAVRARWSIGGFADNQVFEIDPLPGSYEINVEPTNAERVGDTFTLVVTVYDEVGRSLVASHRFEVVAEE